MYFPLWYSHVTAIQAVIIFPTCRIKKQISKTIPATQASFFTAYRCKDRPVIPRVRYNLTSPHIPNRGSSNLIIRETHTIAIRLRSHVSILAYGLTITRKMFKAKITIGTKNAIITALFKLLCCLIPISLPSLLIPQGLNIPMLILKHQT